MRYLVTVIASILLLPGCGDFGSIAASLDDKTEPTQRFWAELQGIEYEHFPEVSQMLNSVKAAGKEYDVDKVSRNILSLSEKHAEIARQLGNLDPTDVDEEATAFRDRRVKSHRNLADSYSDFAQAVKDRDFEKVKESKQSVLTANTDHSNLWDGRTAIMDSLKKKYSREFNVIP